MKVKSGVAVIGYIAICIGVLFVFLVIRGSYPHIRTYDLWLPENHSFFNEIDREGKKEVLPVERVSISGTAVFIPLSDFMKHHGNEDVEIIMEKSGIIHYLTKENGKTYATQRNYGTSFSHFKNVSISENRRQIISQFGTNIKESIPGIVLVLIFIGCGIYLVMAGQTKTLKELF